MLPGKRYKPEDFLAIVWRRKWIILLPFLLCATATVLVVRHLPDEYRSETVILVVPQQVPESYVKPTVTERIDARLRSISQEILSRTRLEGIINELNLYQAERRTMVMEDVVDRMRRDIVVDAVRGDSFRVAFKAGSPRVAMQVTERLARLFIDENLRDRANLAQGTEEFLRSQLDDARQRLVAQEKKLEEYRRRHAGELPTQLQSNLTAINNTQLQIQALVESLNRDRDRLQQMQRSLTDLNAEIDEPAEPVRAASAPADAEPAGRTLGQQLETARQNLRALELRLTPEHPDVVRAKRVIAELEAKAAEEAAARPGGAPAAPPLSPREEARRKRVRDLQADIQTLDRQIKQREQEEQRLRGILGGYQAKADAAPARETELIELTRDYSTLQTMYAELLAKSEQSRIAANLESRQIGEQFKVLDPARLPERPFSPDRARLDIMGAAAGLALGLGLTVLLEYRDRSLKTDDDVVAVLSLPVLAMIPVMTTAEDRDRSRRRTMIVSVASAVSVVAAVAALLYWVR